MVHAVVPAGQCSTRPARTIADKAVPDPCCLAAFLSVGSLPPPHGFQPSFFRGRGQRQRADFPTMECVDRPERVMIMKKSLGITLLAVCSLAVSASPSRAAEARRPNI